jgi:5-formyltetrahydrofolate cyclo-ligase
MPESNTTKNHLRINLLAHRQAISTEVRQLWDIQIHAHLLAWWELHRFSTLGVYWPIRSEPDLRPLYAELTKRGVRLALPTVAARDASLDFLTWKPGEPMVKDGYGVMVPQSGDRIAPDALLVPCVGFNSANYRLGYGGGFYDRTLAATPRPTTVGVAYGCGRAEFDAESFDIPLDLVITEAA